MNSFHKRVAACYFLIVAIMFVCILRLCSIVIDPLYKTASQNASLRKISIGYSRGTVYDTNGLPLTNANIKYCNLICDKPTALITLSSATSSDEFEALADEIRNSGFALFYTDEKLTADGIYSFAVTEHNSKDTLASHIIGYTDAQGRGLCGLEQSFDELLSSEKENYITVTLNGRGEILEGVEPTLSYDYKTEQNGVKTTIDSAVQAMVEKQARYIGRGAIVVTEIESGKIRALVSCPDYDLTSPGDALEDADQPLLNRAFCTYNIGSVFKPYVAAAGYEKNLYYHTECRGYAEIDGLLFGCHSIAGHGKVDMSAAIKYSCNSFFYEYIQGVGGSAVVELARRAGFENGITLADGMVCRAGSLGNTALYGLSKRSLANLSIGQGELMLSPLAITNLYMAIAGGGSYRTPSLVEETINGENVMFEALPAKTYVMSKDTAIRIKNELAGVLEEGGTGVSAAPTLTTAAGKTGTAQTGIIREGKKVTNSWFCGFFPFDKPKYVVTILSENAQRSCSSIFAAIADEITAAESK